MGFYSTSTPAQKRVNKLTGDININDIFKSETQKREIPIYQAYNIQKRLIHEVEQEILKTPQDVDDRLMELLDENSKVKVSHNFIELVDAEEPLKKGMIPARPKSSLPPKEEIKIPPRARDGKKFPVENKEESSVVELLNKLVLQNQKIINQNKIIIEELKRIGD